MKSEMFNFAINYSCKTDDHLMAYIDKALLDGEQVLYQARMHWFAYAGPVILVVLGVAGFCCSFFFDARYYAHTWSAIPLGLLWLGYRYLKFQSYEFVVTNKRVILKTGIISRKIVELQLSKTEAIAFAEGILGRVLGFGTIYVTTGGVANTYRMIAEPFMFRRAISQAIDAEKNDSNLRDA